MLDGVLISAGGIFIVVGILGCFLPFLPGPPLSYAGLILLQLSSKQPFTVSLLSVFAALTVFVVLLDYVVPVYGTKKFQGSKFGIWGCAVGMILGIIFFAPLGIIIGPVLGAFTGEVLRGQKAGQAVKSALGSFIGFMAGVFIKLVLSVTMAYHFVIVLI